MSVRSVRLDHFVLLFTLLLLAACAGAPERASTLPVIRNVTFEGSPNETRIGPVDAHRREITLRVGERGVVTAFRASECGRPAPSFLKVMTSDAAEGLIVPDGIVLFDAGIADYASSRCGGVVPARAIGVIANSRGDYRLAFFGGRAVRTVHVR